MTDFKAAFQQAMELAQNHKLARDEVNSIFDSFVKQIEESSENLVTVCPKPVSRIGRCKIEIQTMAHGSFAGNLCNIEFADSGYPVLVEFNSLDDEDGVYCSTKEAFEEALVQVLLEPKNARLIFNLMWSERLRALSQKTPPHE